MSRESDELTPEPLVPEPNQADLVHPVVSDPFSLEGGAPPADEPAPRRRMRRAWGRGLAGLAVSGLAAATAVAGALAPWPGVSGSAASVDVTPAPSETVLACEGPILALGRDATAAGAISIAGPVQLTAGTGSGDHLEPQPLAQPAAPGDDAPLRFVQVPVDRETDPIAAASSAHRDDDDLTGFAASACRPPALESWIVGGDTGVGESDILLLANPTDASATVELTVFGAADPVTPPGYGALSIPAATQIAVPLAGIAGADADPVIRVTATGSPVRAALQSSLVRTLDPAGLDRQGAVTSAARQVFPGVVVTEAAAGGEGAAAIVRLLGRGGGEATITATPADGGGAASEFSVAYQADRPVAVELGDLPAGRYTVTVEAGEPLVAAAWQTTGFGQEVDFAWQTPSPEVTAATLLAVPEGPEPTLHLAGPAATDVTLTDDTGATATVTVGATGASVPLRPGATYTVDAGDAPIHGAVSYLGERAIASIPLWPDPAAPEPVTVYPR